MRVLIDGDIVVFRCGFAAEHMMWYLKVGDDTHEFRYKKDAIACLDELLPGKHSRKEGEDYELWSERQLEPLNHATQNVRTLIESINEATDTTEFDTTVFLSGPTNYRYDVAKTRPYKWNRDSTHRPTYEAEIKSYIVENWETVISDGEEADDLMAITQTASPKDTVIATIDKDLNQVPGLKYNFADHRLFDVTQEQANYNFHMQLMTGDTTDGIPGLPGIGPGKAAKALHGITDPLEQQMECWRMYQIHSGVDDPWEYMVEQGRLLWLRRLPDQMWYPNIPKEGEAFDAEALSLY